MSSLFTSELKEGMITLTDTYSTEGKLILPRDTVITEGIIHKLINNNVVFVEISDERTVADENAVLDVGGLIAAEASKPDASVTSRPEYRKFKRRYEKNIRTLDEHLNDIVHKNAPLDVDTMLNNTLNILRATESPLSIFTMLQTMKDYDDSTFNHSLNVSLICNLFGRWLEFSESNIELLTVCGLFHDIGKLLIPESIIKKPGKLTEKEFAVVKQHPKLGYDLLKERKADIEVQYAALMHHEKFDASGYPLGLSGSQIHWAAQIVTIADIYEAMTASRVYRGPLSPFHVINMFESDGLQKYNPQYLLTFLEHVVNSYMNCKVKLSNGEEGDIVYINRVRFSKPMVKTKNNFIDLSKNTDISIESIL